MLLDQTHETTIDLLPEQSLRSEFSRGNRGATCEVWTHPARCKFCVEVASDSAPLFWNSLTELLAATATYPRLSWRL